MFGRSGVREQAFGKRSGRSDASVIKPARLFFRFGHGIALLADCYKRRLSRRKRQFAIVKRWSKAA